MNLNIYQLPGYPHKGCGPENSRQWVGHPAPQFSLVHAPRERTYGWCVSKQYPLERQMLLFPQQDVISSEVHG